MTESPSPRPQPSEASEDGGSHAAYRLDEQIGYLLRRSYQRHLAIFQDAAGDQITSVQFSALCTLRDRGPISQSELVAATAIDQATIRGILDRLRTRSLVSFGRDPADARKVIVSVTEAGARLLDDFIPEARRVTESTYGDLNPAERVALLFLLKKISGIGCPD